MLTWNSKTQFGGAGGLAVGASFVINGIVYAATGVDGGSANSCWAYNPATDTWTQKANFGGTGRRYASGFGVNGKGYIACGFDGSNLYDDLRCYTPGTNSWAQKSNFGSIQRNAITTLVIDGVAYAGLGTGWASACYQDWWAYDPVGDTWTQKANFPGTARGYAAAFAIGAVGYVGTGMDASNGLHSDLYAYTPAGNSWTAKASLPGGAVARRLAFAFALGGKGYLGTGYNSGMLSDMWCYTPGDDSWAADSAFPQACDATIAAAVGSAAFAGVGSTTGNTRGWWGVSLAPTGDWTYELQITARLLFVDASDIAAPEGLSITGYAWSWGDSTPDGAGVTNAHHYSAGGAYTVTLTLTLSDDSTYSISKEITMATITKVSTASGPLAKPGVDVITIAGTSLPTTGVVKIGGKSAAVQTSPARSATAIAVIAAADTDLGAQTVEVLDAATPPVLRASAPSAIMIYDPTDERNGADVPFLAIDYVWIDGLNVGYAGEGFKFTPGYTTKEYVPPNAFLPVNVKAFLTGLTLDLRIDQVNGAALAIVLGGTWDATSKTLTVNGDVELASHSIVAKDTNGNITLVRAAKVTGGGSLTHNKDFGNVEITFTAIKLTGVALLERYEV